MDTETTLRKPNDIFHSLPKVDLHRHLEGSLRLRTLLEVGRAHGLDLPNTNLLRHLVQVRQDEPLTIENFLSKFRTLRLFYKSPDVIGRLAREAVVDAAEDNIRYLELRFTPAALQASEGFPLGEVMDWVIAGVRQAEQQTGITTRLIASVNRHESLQLAEEVVRLAADRIDQGIVAVDLAGNEASFSAMIFAGVFREARQAGLRITCHAGEWGGPENITEAITSLGAERIGHGVRVLQDPSVTALARERGTVFEVCITSNYQSGVFSAIDVHPLPRMLAHRLKVTINSDDPQISDIRLSGEFKLAHESLGLNFGQLHACLLTAARAAFLPTEERQRLENDLTRHFALK